MASSRLDGRKEPSAHASVSQAVEEYWADAFGISTATLLSLPEVRGLVSDMREKFKTRCPRIVGGGGAFRSAPAPALALALESVLAG